jgi:hypothetical protein
MFQRVIKRNRWVRCMQWLDRSLKLVDLLASRRSIEDKHDPGADKCQRPEQKLQVGQARTARTQGDGGPKIELTPAKTTNYFTKN